MANEKTIETEPLRVRMNSTSGQKVVTIPKESPITLGDFVICRKVKFS